MVLVALVVCTVFPLWEDLLGSNNLDQLAVTGRMKDGNGSNHSADVSVITGSKDKRGDMVEDGGT